MGGETIKDVLMERDEMSEIEADAMIDEAKADLKERLENGEMPLDFCEEWFSLEEDYLMELF